MKGPTRDDWLKAVAEAGLPERTNDPDALTAPEFADLFDPPLHVQTARRRLEAMVKAGLARRTQKQTAGSDGRRLAVTAYTLVT